MLPRKIAVPDRCVEDEGAGEEATGAPGTTGGGAGQGPQGLPEEGPESHTRALRIPEPHRERLSQHLFFFLSQIRRMGL